MERGARPTAQFVDLDLTSEGGRRLLASVEAKHGAALASFAARAARVFAISSPTAPGLRFIGAEAHALAPDGGAVGPVFSLGGTGLSLPDALASCLGEGVERLSQIARAGDIVCHAALGSVRGRVPEQVEELLGLVAASAASPDVDIGLLAGDWIAGADLMTGAEILLPLDWCLRAAVPGPLAIPGAALSTGAAAGPTPEAAAVRAVLELIERDAVALWWMGGRRARPIALEHPAMGVAVEVLGQVRQGMDARSTWLLDVTTDLDIPAVVAVSVAEDGRELACGMAARLVLADAARAAILEMCQMEVATLVVDLKRRQRGANALNAVDHRHLARATTIDAAKCVALWPVGLPRTLARDDPPASDGAALVTLADTFAGHGLQVGLVELTRPDTGIPVMLAVAPRLQRFPSGIRSARLQQIIAEFGGGADINSTISLL